MANGTVTKVADTGFDWGKATVADLSAALKILYPTLPLDPSSVKKEVLVGLVTGKAKGRTLEELQETAKQAVTKRTARINPSIMALTYPAGLQMIFTKLGSTYTVVEKAPVGSEFKAYQALQGIITRKHYTVEDVLNPAWNPPVSKKGSGGKGSFRIKQFTIGEPDLCPVEVTELLQQLQILDPTIIVGRGHGPKPTLRFRMPGLTGELIFATVLPEEYQLVSE